MPQLHCPYTTSLLSDLPAVNREHILPVGFGAPESFTVPASAAENARMAELIDGPVCNDPLWRFLAMTQGVVSRSGPVSATLDGHHDASGEEVRAAFGLDLPALALRFRVPIEKDATGQVTGVRGFGDDARAFAEKVRENYARKGITVAIGDEVTEEHPLVNFSVNGDVALLRRELIKIAYLMTVRVFGDSAILSPSGAIYRTAMFAETSEAIAATGLRGGSDLQAFPAHFLLPKPASTRQHVLSCFYLGGALISVVTLFGTFSTWCVTSAEGLSPADGEGEIVIIDASQQAIVESRSFLDWLTQVSRTMGSTFPGMPPVAD